ncbi:YhgE/Pip domain-containing protein [Nocardia gamkensis]|uniref:YhgE/Pip domain-containing protein n=1 Tax=Nocardia gamkensis TaxID=352869 RepID=UPI0037CB67B5
MTVRTFTAPIAVLTVFAALLATMYLGYAGNTEKNLHDFPIALVNQDVGDTLDGKPANIGAQVTDALVAGIPAEKIDLRVLGIAQAREQLQDGEVYGAIVIPSDFTKRLAILGAAAVVPGEIERPVITVRTNPRIGPYTTGIMQRVADRALNQVDETVGKNLTGQVNAALAAGPGAPVELTGAARLMLADPVQIVTAPYRPMDDGAGQGLVAFFYTLILLLAGFTGAMIIHTLVDSVLGFTPTEYGPWFVHQPATGISRFRTLLMKWAVVLTAAPILSGIFLAVAAALGVPLGSPLLLWLYGILAIVAVGVTALAVLATFGTAGLLVNLILFVVLGLPSSAATVPLEATPAYIAKLAAFEPMHQIYLAVRAIMFFDAHAGAGLGHGLWMTLLGLGIGLVLGVTATYAYDRRGLHRAAAPLGSAPAVGAPAVAG